MYGQKTTASVASAGISVASWWMWGATVVLAAVALILLARTFIAFRSRDSRRRP